MKQLNAILVMLGTLFFLGCSQENCKIDFESKSNLYNSALKSIYTLNLEMNSNETYFRPIREIRIVDSLVSSEVFNEIEYIEVHEDSTIIFQAPNCNSENGFRDVVYLLAYVPKGIEHLKGKRNLGDYNKIKEDWYLAEHLNSTQNRANEKH